MYVYFILMAAMLLPFFIYFYFFVKRILGLILKEHQRKWKRRTALIITAVIAALSWNIFSFWAMVVLHITGIAIGIELIRLVFIKGLHKQSHRWHVIYCSGILPILGTFLILCYGYLNMQYVLQTEYTVVTEKEIREAGYDVVFLSDLHYGTTMKKEKLQTYCERIEQNQPDLIVLGGDIVDERTTLHEMQEAFQTLGQMDSTYGIYYVYGNHDKARYSRDSGFTEKQLEEAIENSGIRILEDETCEVNQELVIAGRRDRSDSGMNGTERKASESLVKSVPSGAYRILADHQPRSFAENEAAGFDLMLSGHTHAGQMWPVGLFTTLFDKDTLNYGYKQEGTMDIIVSSGIAGWGYPVRTGKHCEYVLVHIQKE